MLGKRLRNQSGGICEIDKPCLGCESLHDAGMRQGYRKCSQGHRHAAGTGCFLTCQALLDGNSFVSRPSRHASNAQATKHKIAVLDRVFHGICCCQAQTHAQVLRDFPSQGSHKLRPARVNVEQLQFSDAEQRLGLQ